MPRSGATFEGRRHLRLRRTSSQHSLTAADTGCVGTRSLPVLGIAAFAAVVPVALLHFVGGEDVAIDGWVHFAGVAFGAGVATVSAAALTIAGARAGGRHALLVGAA